MVGRLITLPMRLSLRVAGALLRAVLAPPRAEPEGERPTPFPSPPQRRPAPPRSQAPRPRPEPSHVSEEPVLVEQRAEPGAEDGAGPSVSVDEPWQGYRESNAKEVLTRVRAADSAELAAIELYERANRNRRTVLNAVRRELQSKNGST